MTDFSNMKAVFFDFDDTLGNREEYAYDTYYNILKENTNIQDEIEFEAILQDVMIWDEHGNIYKDHITDMLKKKYNIVLPYDNFLEYWNSVQYKSSVPFQDTLHTLDVLSKKYKLGIITNGNSEGQRNKIKQAGLLEYFNEDNIVVSGDYGFHKPDTRLFIEASKKLDVDIHDCVYVGDIFANDVLGAYKSGMKPIWIWSHGNRKCSANITRISKISDILNIL